MPTRRLLAIVILLLFGLAAAMTVGQAPAVPAVRWPADDAIYELGAWALSPPIIDNCDDCPFPQTRVIRTYAGADGSVARVVLWVSPEAKRNFHAAADATWLGAGYTTQPASLNVPGVETLLATRGQERWLSFSTCGERRGLVGCGPSAWGLAAWDLFASEPNEYFRLQFASRVDPPGAPSSGTLAQFAQILFERVAHWYAGGW